MPPEIIKGLKDVYFDTTESSFIDGIEGKLLYRGYNIHDLAEKSTFEEVVYLLLYGKLPNTKQLAEFDALMRANRIIPDDVIQILDLIKTGHPMDAIIEPLLDKPPPPLRDGVLAHADGLCDFCVGEPPCAPEHDPRA